MDTNKQHHAIPPRTLQPTPRPDRPRFSKTGLASLLSAHVSSPYSEIIPRLYLGSLRTVKNETILTQHNITHILTILPPDQTPELLGRVHLKVALLDRETEDLLAILPATTKWIGEALSDPQAVVMVHCEHGVSRSASVVVAWLMVDRKWSLDQALGFVKEKRVSLKPNPGFLRQLEQWEEIMKRNS